MVDVGQKTGAELPLRATQLSLEGKKEETSLGFKRMIKQVNDHKMTLRLQVGKVEV
jgi:hypothetical protein